MDQHEAKLGELGRLSVGLGFTERRAASMHSAIRLGTRYTLHSTVLHAWFVLHSGDGSDSHGLDRACIATRQPFLCDITARPEL